MIWSRLRGVAQLPIWGSYFNYGPSAANPRNSGSTTKDILLQSDVATIRVLTHLFQQAAADSSSCSRKIKLIDLTLGVIRQNSGRPVSEGAVPAQGPDYSLHIRRLPGTARCGDNLPDIERLHLVLKQQPIDSIPVADEVARRFSFVERLNQLLRSPGGGRMFCHVEVHELTAIMTKNDENEQETERSRGDGEEIDRSKFPDVVIQKRSPVLRRRFPSFRQPARDNPLGDIDSELP